MFRSLPKLTRPKLSRKELATIRIYSGADGGFLAALAEWLFDLRVTIHAEDGTLLYTNCEHESQAQVFLIFTYLRDESTLQTPITLTETFFLRDISEFVVSGNASLNAIGGRLDWHNCLSICFDTEFTKLTEHAETVGTLIGCTARLLGKTVQSPVESPVFHMIDSTYRSIPRSASLLDAIFTRFSELLPLRRYAYEPLDLSLKMAIERYFRCATELEDICRCKACCPEEVFARRDLTEDQHYLESARCLLNAFWTILKVCKIMCNVTLHGDLTPTRYGFEQLRALQAECSSTVTRCCVDTGAPGTTPAEQIRVARAFVETSLIAHLDPFHLEGATSSIDEVLLLFSGNPSFQRCRPPDKVSSVSHAGICVYNDTLREPSVSNELIGRLHVTAGWIEHAERRFSRITDMRHENRSQISMHNFDVARGWASQFDNLKLHVADTARSLQVEYVFSSASKSYPDISIGPCAFDLAKSTLTRESQCSQQFCPTIDMNFGTTQTVHKVRTEYTSSYSSTLIGLEMLKLLYLDIR